MTRDPKKWSDLTATQRRLVVALGCAEVGLTVTALTDLARRASAQVRGPKALWALSCIVQPVGPVAYLLLGRRRP
jgi:hypothetical protein